MKAFPRDIEVSNMTERHVGIENELCVGRSSDDLPREAAQAIVLRGLLRDVGYDCGAREFRTNPISIKSLYQVRGHKYLMEYYDILRNNTRTRDGNGTHIHISILDKDHVNMESNATAMGIAFYSQFQKVAGRQTTWARRHSYRSVGGLRIYLNRDRRRPHDSRTYYRMGGMLSPTMYKTLEFRGPKGTTDGNEILAWVEFINNVVKASNHKSADGVKFQDLLEGERISEYVKGLTGWRKLTKSDLEKTFNGASLY